jgi:hypothetical protein
VLERVIVCKTSCWRSVIVILAALPGIVRTSPKSRDSRLFEEVSQNQDNRGRPI